MAIQEIVIFHTLSDTYKKKRQGSYPGRTDWIYGKTRKKDFALFVLLKDSTISLIIIVVVIVLKKILRNIGHSHVWSFF